MRTRDIFSYIMWGLFAVLLSVLYYFSAMELVNSFNILGNKYNYIIVIAVGIIIALLVFLLNKLLKEGQLTSGNKKYQIYGIIGFIISLICFAVYRLWYADSTVIRIQNEAKLNELYKRSLIGAEGNIFLKGDSIKDLYDSLMSISFKFLGNNALGIYVAEFVIGLLAFIFTYYAIKAIYGRIEAFVVAVGISFMPVFLLHNRPYSLYLLEYLIFALALYSVSISKRLLKTRYGAELGACLAGLVCGFAYLYDNITIGLIFLLILLIIEEKELKALRKFTSILAGVITFILVFMGALLLEAYYANNMASLGTRIINVLNYRITGSFSLKNMFEFTRTNFILIVIIACIAYVVTFLKCKFDEAHSMILLFIISFLAMCYFAGDDILPYSLVCTMGLLCIAGAGIKKLIGFKQEEPEDDPEEEEPKPVYDEQDPDIEILDHGTEEAAEEPTEEPEETPEEEPTEEPEETPEEDPGEEPEETPEEDPGENPEDTPEEEPVEEPEETPEVKPEEIEEVTVEIDSDANLNISELTGSIPDKLADDEPSWIVKGKNNNDVKLFVTPLPMPKKGVKKVVKYDYEVPDDMMHYDIELNDENSFYDVV